jgi:hypothetical protein
VRKPLALVALLPFFACVGDDTTTTIDAGPDVTAQDTGSDVVTAGDVTDNGGPWTPAVLDSQGSLALWLEASPANLVISSGHIEQWTDLSSNHNNATNPSGGPTSDTSVINGHDAVLFAMHGVVLGITDATSLQFGTDQFLMMAVARESTSGLYFFSKAQAGVSGGGSYFRTGIEFLGLSGPYDGGTAIAPYIEFAEDPTDSGTITSYPATWQGSVFGDGNFHIVGARRTDAFDMVLLVDGQPPQTTSTGDYDVSQVGSNVEIGSVAYGSINPQMNGEIAELVVVHATIIADATLTSLQTYFTTKYGL